MLTGLLILLICGVVLAIPLAFEFNIEWPEAGGNEFVIVWAFGHLRVQLPTERSVAVPSENGAEIARERRKDRSSRNVLAALKQRSFRRRIYRFVADLWHSITKEDLYLRVRLGLGDPAATGQLWGVLGPISNPLTNAKNVSLVVEPDFIEERLEVEGSGRLQLVPLKVIAITIAFLVSPEIWRGIYAMRES